jgi:hypothetical protein
MLFTLSAFAVSTDYWEINTKPELAKGDFDNTVLTPAGEVVLGKKPVKIALEKETSLWCGVQDKKGAYYFGSGSGKIYKLSGKEDKLDEVFDTKEILVTALAVSDNNEIFAATIPNGRIFKIDRDGKGITFCQLAVAYVWALGFGPDNNLYASTGPVPNIYKISNDGKPEPFYEAKKGMHIMSFLFDNQDNLFFATSYPGIVYRYQLKQKKADIIYDLGESEIRSMLLSPDKQTLYLAVNSASRMMPQDFLGAVKGAAEEAKKPDAPPPAPIAAPLPPPKQKPPVQSAIYTLTLANRIKELIRFEKSYLTDLKYLPGGKQDYLLAATDNNGKIYQIALDGTLSIPYDLEVNNIMALMLDNKSELKLVATGGASAVYLYPAADVVTGSYIADVFDGRFMSDWGSLAWENSKDITLSIRTGNTDKPDDTWSAWSDDITTSPAKLNAAPSRYIQVKATLKSKDAALTAISLAYLTTNQQPRLMDMRIENIRKPLEGQPALPHMPQRTVAKKIVYQATDADGDPLGYRLYYRRENQTHWTLINATDLIIAPEYIWNTESVDDGKYLIKAEVTDERNNPKDRALADSKISKPVIVDNTKPVIMNTAFNGKSADSPADRGKSEYTGEVADNFSYIERIEYSVDNQPWELVYPKDNLFDEKTEKFTAQLKNLSPGTHSITFRAWDSEGNLGTKQEEFSVK